MIEKLVERNGGDCHNDNHRYIDFHLNKFEELCRIRNLI